MLDDLIEEGNVLRALYDGKLDLEPAPEPPRRIVRLCSVVVQKDVAVAVITEEGATKFSNIGWRFHPARRLRIEISKFLQFSILFFP